MRKGFWQTINRSLEFPSFDAHQSFDLAIVGGGVAGLATALQLRNLGFRGSVALAEKDDIGVGATGRSGGMLYVDENYLLGSGQAFEAFTEMCRSWRLQCDIELSNGRLTGVEGEHECALLDPQRLAHEMAAAAHRANCAVFVRSSVDYMYETEGAEVAAINGFELRARAVLIATGSDLNRFGGTPAVVVSPEECLVVDAGQEPVPWAFCGPIGLDDDFLWGRRIGVQKFLCGGGQQYSSSASDKTARLALLRTGLEACLPHLARARLVAQWTGEITRFAVPCDMVGPAGGRRIYAGGLGGNGLLAATTVGKCAAER